MGTESLIDDVLLDDERLKGGPILFTIQEFRKMIRLANVDETDVFHDLCPCRIKTHLRFKGR